MPFSFHPAPSLQCHGSELGELKFSLHVASSLQQSHHHELPAPYPTLEAFLWVWATSCCCSMSFFAWSYSTHWQRYRWDYGLIPVESHMHTLETETHPDIELHILYLAWPLWHRGSDWIGFRPAEGLASYLKLEFIHSLPCWMLCQCQSSQLYKGYTCDGYSPPKTSSEIHSMRFVDKRDRAHYIFRRYRYKSRRCTSREGVQKVYVDTFHDTQFPQPDLPVSTVTVPSWRRGFLSWW